MTKYVLNSGGIDNHPEKLPAFLEEAFHGYQKIRILLCHFAKQPEKWLTEPAGYEKIMVDFVPNISYQIADFDNFEKLSQWATHIHFSGGDASLAGSVMQKYNLDQCFENKVVFGNSGGVGWLGHEFWSTDRRGIFEGLKILPFKFIPHFNSQYGADRPEGPVDWSSVHQEMQNIGNQDLPIYAIEEGDFIVIEK